MVRTTPTTALWRKNNTSCICGTDKPGSCIVQSSLPCRTICTLLIGLFFVAREASAQVVEAEPDTDVAQHRRALIHSGMCIFEARIGEDGAGAYKVSWDGQQGQKMKTGSSVWLSRTDPEIDAEKYTFPISEKKKAHMTLAATHELR